MDISDKYESRQAQPNDLKAIQQLLKSGQLPYKDITLEKLNHYFLIGKSDNPVGLIGLEKYEHDGLLRSLVVSKEYQNNGIGQLLVKRLEEHAKSLRIQTLYLLTTTAAPFFNKLDYVEIDRDETPGSIRQSEEFSSICPASATLMKKDL